MADKTLNYYDTATQTWKSPYATNADLTILGQTVSDLSDTVTQHLQENNYQQLTLQNGWGGGISYKKDTHNNLCFYVSVSGGVNSAGTLLGTLPVGYRPKQFSMFVCVTTTDNDPNPAVTLITVDNSGDVKLEISAKQYILGQAMINGGGVQ